jgi:methylphosphotriester-DNA--protein-cysteine methyltransferase
MDSTPWTEGFRACQRGEPRDTNPWPDHTKKSQDWFAGWDDLDAHQNAKESALDSIGWFG